jgi:hypothetical protein
MIVKPAWMRQKEFMYRNANAKVVRKVQDGAGAPSTFTRDVRAYGGMNDLRKPNSPRAEGGLYRLVVVRLTSAWPNASVALTGSPLHPRAPPQQRVRMSNGLRVRMPTAAAALTHRLVARSNSDGDVTEWLRGGLQNQLVSLSKQREKSSQNRPICNQ